MRLTEKEYRAAVENLREEDFSDFEANFKVPLRLKIELNIIFLIAGVGGIYGIAAIGI